MNLVIVESPYAGNVEFNVEYARAAMTDCLKRGTAPFASHLLYTQPGVLDDLVPAQRSRGIEAGLSWGRAAVEWCGARVAFYCDLGWSPGMVEALRFYRRLHAPMERRFLGAPWSNMVTRRDECYPSDSVLLEVARDGETWDDVLKTRVP